MPCQRVDERLGHVLEHGEASGHVAVEGAVADGHLALVARGQNKAAEAVGAVIAYPPTKQGETGTWAIYILDGMQYGLWQR